MLRWRAELLLGGITALWGGTFALVKLALQAVPPFLFMGMRFTVALGILLVVWRSAFHRFRAEELRYGSVLGLCFAAGFVLQTVGLLFTSASKSAFITGATLLVIPVMQWAVQRRQPTLWQWAGVGLALVGLWYLTAPSLEGWNVGDVLTMASTLFWALYVVLLDEFTRHSPPVLGRTLRLTALQFAVSAAVGGAAHLLCTAMGVKALAFAPDFGHPHLWVALAYTAVLASVVATVVQTHVQRYTTPVKAALIYALEPVFASVLAWALLGELLAQRELLGAALLLASIGVAEFSRVQKGLGR